MARSRKRRVEASRTSDDSFQRLLTGWKRTETRRGQEWTVQPVSAQSALKQYKCPGCGREVATGVAHLVVWRADGVLGDAADLAGRRHWHDHCWQVN